MQCAMEVQEVAVIVLLCTLFTANGEEKKPCKTSDGKIVTLGEQYDIPGYCYGNICKGNNEFSFKGCGIITVPYGWTVTNLDPTKGFPKCCGEALPPLKIVPDILDHLQSSESLDISYEGNISVDMGNELTSNQVRIQPSVKYTSADPTAFYLLTMVDPDTLNVQNSEARQFLHWLVGNIPGDDVASGEVLAEYIGSGPRVETGLHRYVFLLYKQPEKLIFDKVKINNNTSKGRKRFSVRKFAEKYRLCDPVAINVYQG